MTDLRRVLGIGTATSIGSLPHLDAHDAARFELRHHPRLPAAPSLPARDPREGMLAQVLAGVPGVTLDGEANLTVDTDALGRGEPAPRIDETGHAGLLAFLDAIAERDGPYKLQATGPVTVAMALLDAGASYDRAVGAAAAAVEAYLGELLAVTAARTEAGPLVVFLDEPALTALGDPAFPIDPDSAVDLVSGALAGLERHAVTGLHCCGPTEWSTVLGAGPRILSVPVDARLRLAATALADHLERDGWIAWGAIPTDRPMGTTGDAAWRRLSNVWCELVRRGCDPVRLRAQALVTPACGLATHGLSQADRALELASRVAERIATQAHAARFSVGA